MALMIRLCVGLICTSTTSALLINPPRLIQPPTTELDPVPQLLNNMSTHGSTNKSQISLPTGEVLDQGYSTSPSKLNLSAEPTFYCDEGWGRDLNLQMCEEAFASIPWVIGPETRPLSFGPREANTFDIGLPRRFMSADGICAIQPFLVPGKASAHVAPLGAYIATGDLIQKCVGGNPSKGGQVRGFGGDNNLVVSVSEYDPHLWSDKVQCFGSTDGPGIIESCNGLADRMDASESLKTFGPYDSPHEYLTPYTLTADNRCYLKITTNPGKSYTRVASWHDIWEAAILVNAMCIRAGKKGAFKFSSFDMDVRWLKVEVGDLLASNNLTLQITPV